VFPFSQFIEYPKEVDTREHVPPTARLRITRFLFESHMTQFTIRQLQ